MKDFSLFEDQCFSSSPDDESHPVGRDQRGEDRDLGQFFTAEWAALRLVEHYYPYLGPNHFVVEPTAGPGPFLKAIPAHVPAIGLEICPKLAAFSSANTGREVICGDFRKITLPRRPTTVIGNPPWDATTVNDLVSHFYPLLEDGGEMGMILPTHSISYSGPVLEWAKRWSIAHELLPKSLFPRLRWPVSFVRLRKEEVRTMVGFFLFEEAEALKGMSPTVKLLLVRGKPRVSLWRAVVTEALVALGRRASLSQIYAFVEGRRPKPIRTWRDTIRRVLQEGPFTRLDDGSWALASA